MKWETRFFLLFHMIPKRYREEYLDRYILEDDFKICSCGYVICKEGVPEE